jgi:hypothetical protein
VQGEVTLISNILLKTKNLHFADDPGCGWLQLEILTTKKKIINLYKNKKKIFIQESIYRIYINYNVIGQCLSAFFKLFSQ